MKWILLSLLNLFSTLLLGQVTFSSIPLNKQLFPRDLVTNLGTITVEGQVNYIGAPYSLIKLNVYRDLLLIDTFSQALNYNANNAPFSFHYDIPAELAEYTITIYGINGSSIGTKIDSISDIVAGDAYVIQGQSNAEARNYYGSSNGNKSNFIRVFASGTDNPGGPPSNIRWYFAQGDGPNYTDGNAGQWGLKFARMLMDSLNIPIAIFNGAQGGQKIDFFQAPANYATSLNSNYGRLYYRAKVSGLKDYVRAVFWSQGESDGAAQTTGVYYKAALMTLIQSWMHDFKNIEKIYILQTKNGCGDPLNQIKEAQRQVAVESEIVDIAPTASCTQFTDYCHFQYMNGYECFGKRLYLLVARDLYGHAANAEIDAPMITAAYLLNDTTLVVETDADTLIWASAPSDFQLQNTDSVAIESIYLLGSKIVFDLSAHPSDSATISYWAPPTGTQGNLVTNGNNIELICFDKVPIAQQATISVSGAIYTELAHPIPGVVVTLTGSDQQETVTDTNGQYSFTMAGGGRYVITPSMPLTSIADNSITALDLLLTQSNILSIDPFFSPYKIIAADGDASGTVTVTDIILGRLIILGNTSSFPNGRLWEFVKNPYVFPNPLHPFPFPKSKTYDSLISPQIDQDFIGVRLGDVNNTWDTSVH